MNTVEASRIRDNQKVIPYKFDPDATTLTAVGWVDMQNYRSLLCTLLRTVGTSAITNCAIHANTASDGSGDDVQVWTKDVSTIDAVGDYAHVEVSQEQLMQLANEDGKAYRYASLKLQFATGTDEAAVTYTQAEPRHAGAGLTTDYAA